MKLELTDWIDYHEGRKDFDKGHFYTLLMEKEETSFTEEGYHDLFQFFPNEEQLIDRLKKYFSRTDCKKEIDSLDSYLTHATREDIFEKKKLIDDQELLSILNGEIKLINNHDEFCEAQLDDWHSEYISSIGDALRKLRSLKTYALFEAYYGITTNYQLVWYLGAPLIDTDSSLDHYFDIWKVGGDYAVTKDAIVVYKYA